MKSNFFNFFSVESFIQHFCFSYGGNSAGGRGDTTTATTDASQHTTVSTTNQQVGASEGSTAFGANSTVNIENSDSEVVAGAFKFAEKAFASSDKSVTDALFFAAKQGSEANQLVSKVLDKNPTPTNDNIALLQGVSSVVSENLKSASSTVDTTGNKNLVVTIATIGAALGAIFLFKRSRA